MGVSADRDHLQPADQAGCAALEKKSAVMEEDQLHERHLGIHGDENTRKVQESVPQVLLTGFAVLRRNCHQHVD